MLPLAPSHRFEKTIRLVPTNLRKVWLRILSTFCVGWREMHHIAMLIFDKGDPENMANALACLRELISEAAEMGDGEYRTHLILQDQVAATYNWNNSVNFDVY